MTDREIHNIAEMGYAKRTGKERVGYSVRWETKRNATGYMDADVAGYLNRSDAVKLARKMIRAGRTGVVVNVVRNANKPAKDHAEDYFQRYSCDAAPEYVKPEAETAVLTDADIAALPKVDTKQAIQLMADEAQKQGAECNDRKAIVRAIVQAHGLGFNAWFCVCCELADREARKAGYESEVDRAYALSKIKIAGNWDLNRPDQDRS